MNMKKSIVLIAGLLAVGDSLHAAQRAIEAGPESDKIQTVQLPDAQLLERQVHWWCACFCQKPAYISTDLKEVGLFLELENVIYSYHKDMFIEGSASFLEPVFDACVQNMNAQKQTEFAEYKGMVVAALRAAARENKIVTLPPSDILEKFIYKAVDVSYEFLGRNSSLTEQLGGKTMRVRELLGIINPVIGCFASSLDTPFRKMRFESESKKVVDALQNLHGNFEEALKALPSCAESDYTAVWGRYTNNR